MTDFLSGFHAAVVERIHKYKKEGRFRHFLTEHEPGPPYRLSSEAPKLEPLPRVGSRDPAIARIDRRRAAVYVSSGDLLGLEEQEELAKLAATRVEDLLDLLDEQLRHPEREPEPVADPDRNPMWRESATTRYDGCLASRTVARKGGSDDAPFLQDRLTAMVTIPDFCVVVFAALVWERITPAG